MTRQFIPFGILLASALNISMNSIKGETTTPSGQYMTVGVDEWRMLVKKVKQLEENDIKKNKEINVLKEKNKEIDVLKGNIKDLKCGTWEDKLIKTVGKIGEISSRLSNTRQEHTKKKHSIARPTVQWITQIGMPRYNNLLVYFRKSRNFYAQEISEREQNYPPEKYASKVLEDFENLLLLAIDCDENKLYNYYITKGDAEKLFDEIKDFRFIHRNGGNNIIRKALHLKYLKKIFDILWKSNIIKISFV